MSSGPLTEQEPRLLQLLSDLADSATRGATGHTKGVAAEMAIINPAYNEARELVASLQASLVSAQEALRQAASALDTIEFLHGAKAVPEAECLTCDAILAARAVLAGTAERQEQEHGYDRSAVVVEDQIASARPLNQERGDDGASGEGGRPGVGPSDSQRDLLVEADSFISHMLYRGSWPGDRPEVERLIGHLRKATDQS